MSARSAVKKLRNVRRSRRAGRRSCRRAVPCACRTRAANTPCRDRGESRVWTKRACGPLPEQAVRQPRARAFPFGLGRQAPPGPRAIRLRLGPAHVPRIIRNKRQPAVETPFKPRAILLFSVARRGAALLDKRRYSALSPRARNAERRKHDFMRHFFVVEHESLRRRGAQHEFAPAISMSLLSSARLFYFEWL